MAKKASKKLEPKDIADLYIDLADRTERGRRMSEVEAFRSVPTILRSFNRATTVGGAPLSCVWLIHGPSMGGKTAFVCALIRSFQRIGGLTAFIDAELAADTGKWFRQLGVDGTQCHYIGRTGSKGKKSKPLTYEEIVEEVSGLIDWYQAGKAEGTIPAGTPFLITVDSLSKMVPKKTLEKLSKEGGSAVGSGVGRLQAALNAAWLISLGPRVGDDDIIFAAIAHEYEEAGGKKGGGWAPAYKVRGGNAPIFDSMMQLRVTFAGQVKDLSADGSPMVGKRHRVRVLKNKHGPAFAEATFYTSNGAGVCSMGFDRPREILHEAITRGVIEGAKDIKLTLGTPVVIGGQKFQVKQFYTGNEKAEEALATLEAELDAQIFEETEGG